MCSPIIFLLVTHYINVSYGNNLSIKLFIYETINKLNMKLPEQFTKENTENILIYHYVEELVGDFKQYSNENYLDNDINLVELPFLLRIRFKDKSTQKDLVTLFNVSNGYASKILRKFEDKKRDELYAKGK